MNYKGLKDSTFICKGCKKEVPFRYYGDGAQFCSNRCQHAAKFQEMEEIRKQQFEKGELKRRDASL